VLINNSTKNYFNLLTINRKVRIDFRKCYAVLRNMMFQTPPRLHKVDYSSEFVLKDCLTQTDDCKNHDRPSCIETRMNAPDKRDNNKFVSVIDHALSVDECNAVISRAEEAGFSQALLSVGVGIETLNTDIRNSDRCIIDDEDFANVLYDRIKQFLPKVYGSSNEKKGWTIVGLNERMRILRYGRGQLFAEHYDASFVRIGDTYGERAGEKSLITVMIYLNSSSDGTILRETKNENNNESDTNQAYCKGQISDKVPSLTDGNCVGGATTLIAQDFTAKDQAVLPAVGRVFVFDHDLLHAGECVKAGLKYAIRTDVMYKEEK